jgi:hypothetical protein
LRSDEMRHGSVPSRPMTPLSATATTREMIMRAA